MKILLVDDHALFREGMALLLRPMVPALETAQAGDCPSAFRMIETGGLPDLVLMDLALPGMDGIAGIALLKERHPGLPLVALSSSDDRDTVLRALDAGAMGFIPKSSTSAVLAAALQLVLARGIYLPPSAFLGGQPVQDVRLPAVGSSLQAAGRSPADLGLTARQTEVLYAILQGKSAKLICRDLGISAGTAKAHTSAVLRALNVTTRTQAVVMAGRLGLRFEP